MTRDDFKTIEELRKDFVSYKKEVFKFKFHQVYHKDGWYIYQVNDNWFEVFKETIAKPNVTLAEAIENIDIGGPAMVRAAAKTFKFVTIITNPARDDAIAEQVAKNGCVDDRTRMELAQEAFAHTAAYDTMIKDYLAEQLKK